MVGQNKNLGLVVEDLDSFVTFLLSFYRYSYIFLILLG